MVYYILLTVLAWRAAILLSRGQLVNTLGINLSDPDYNSGAESASYMVTKALGSNANLEYGDGTRIVTTMLLATARMDANLEFNGTSQLPPFYLPQTSDLVVTFIPDSNYSTTDFANVRARIGDAEPSNRITLQGPFTQYEVRSGIIQNVPSGYCRVGTARTIEEAVNGLLEVAVAMP